MSKAKPMGSARRLAAYRKQTGGYYLTPAQYRRFDHKSNRAAAGKPVGSADGSKGRPTPRQRKARRDG